MSCYPPWPGEATTASTPSTDTVQDAYDVLPAQLAEAVMEDPENSLRLKAAGEPAPDSETSNVVVSPHREKGALFH